MQNFSYLYPGGTLRFKAYFCHEDRQRVGGCLYAQYTSKSAQIWHGRKFLIQRWQSCYHKPLSRTMYDDISGRLLRTAVVEHFHGSVNRRSDMIHGYDQIEVCRSLPTCVWASGHKLSKGYCELYSPTSSGTYHLRLTVMRMLALVCVHHLISAHFAVTHMGKTWFIWLLLFL